MTILYDNRAIAGDGESTVVSASLLRLDDGPALVIRDSYCAGRNNPYWDEDDDTVYLDLSVSETARYADKLGVPVDDLLNEIAKRHSVAGAVDAVRKECEAFGIITNRSVVEPLDDLFGNAGTGGIQ